LRDRHGGCPLSSSTKEIEDAVQRSDLGGSLADMDEDEDGCPKAKPDDAKAGGGELEILRRWVREAAMSPAEEATVLA
jgi:hypothetical protein